MNFSLQNVHINLPLYQIDHAVNYWSVHSILKYLNNIIIIIMWNCVRMLSHVVNEGRSLLVVSVQSVMWRNMGKLHARRGLTATVYYGLITREVLSQLWVNNNECNYYASKDCCSFSFIISTYQIMLLWNL